MDTTCTLCDSHTYTVYSINFRLLQSLRMDIFSPPRAKRPRPDDDENAILRPTPQARAGQILAATGQEALAESINDTLWRLREAQQTTQDALWVGEHTHKGRRYAWLRGKQSGDGPLYTSPQNPATRAMSQFDSIELAKLQSKNLYPNREFLKFYKSQRGELVEAYGQWYYPTYMSHGHDDFIVDGYDTAQKVSIKAATNRLSWIQRKAPALAPIAKAFMAVWEANNRGLYEPMHTHSDCVPLEWKTTKESRSSPTVAQILYLYLFQGKVLTVHYNQNNEFELRKTDFGTSHRYFAETLFTNLQRRMRLRGSAFR